MANIYDQDSKSLHDLLDKASSNSGATVLIPDLQRPYVWSPNQVVLLVDSLIRGWPFGTLLMWKVGQADLQSIPHRQFWQVVDRTTLDDGTTLARKDPPTSYQMVLDGQQRLQSLLLALGGDGWGFKLDDRTWMQEVSGNRPRGRASQVSHWSKASLCFDLLEFISDYTLKHNVLAVDYRTILKWVVTDPTDGQSTWKKPSNYEMPLYVASNEPGRFVRLSRLWTAAGVDGNVKESAYRTKLTRLLQEEGVAQKIVDDVVSPLAELMTTLCDVKLSKVTYLELKSFNSDLWSEDDYNDAIVNIFTRLNTAGRTLTREEITLAWLKVGWDLTKTDSKTAGECFQALLDELKDRELSIEMDDLVGAVSFIWSVRYNSGKLIDNRDLLKGNVIKPMASALSESWRTISDAVISATETVNDRQLIFGAGGHYVSLNSLAIAWGWNYLATNWLATTALKEAQRDDFTKKCADTLAKHIDRWLICSQWAGRWARASLNVVANYAKQFADDFTALSKTAEVDVAHKILESRLHTMVTELESDAAAYVNSLEAASRERVSVYRTALWVWHRLEEKRWKVSQVPLRFKKKKTVSLDVDHTVAHALWEGQIKKTLPRGMQDVGEALSIVNQIGNCILLEKGFNISKGKQPAKEFLDQIHEFKEGKLNFDEWCNALGVTKEMLQPNQHSVDDVAAAIQTRDKTVRKELIEFVKGQKKRVDVSEGSES